MLDLNHYKRRAFEGFLLIGIVLLIAPACVGLVGFETLEVVDSITENLEAIK